MDVLSGTDTNLMEEREFLLNARFTELNVAPSYTCYGALYERRYRYQLLLDSFIQTTTRVLYVRCEAAIHLNYPTLSLILLISLSKI